MRRGLVMLSLMVAAVVLCNHRSAMAEEEQQVELAEVSKSHISLWTLSVPSDGCHEIFKCMLYPNRSCITECCKSYPFSLFPIKFCICWSRAERVNKRAFTALQEYCGFKQYVKCPRMQEINMQQEVDEAIKAIDNKLSSRSNQLMPDACCEQDKQKIKTCMLNTTSAEQCCPTFRAMIGVNCNCYNYAQDLDNQLLIVIESLCDVPNPCNKKAQVM